MSTLPNGGWRELVTPEGVVYYSNAETGETQWEKPDALKNASDQEQAGDWYWLPHDHDGFILARETAKNADGSATYATAEGQSHSLPKDQVTQLGSKVRWSSLRNIESDLVMLDEMTHPLILHHLKERFLKNIIYTNVGNILISINPYKRLPLYTPSVLDSYIKRGPATLPPHVYAIADAAYKQMREHSKGQSIVISGESGAGKTECTKQALQYLAEIAGSSNQVEQRILQANPVLEAFGNAKTVRNNNSSRFGKYVEIFFDLRSSICGARNLSYLLEKSRVVQQSQGERNYHIFYMMLRGLSEAAKQKFKLTRVEDYAYLSQSGCVTIEDVDDVEEFQTLTKAFNDLGFTAAQQDDVYRTLAGILHMGNITFTPTGDRQCSASAADVNTTAFLLQVDEESFRKAVTERVIKVPGQPAVSTPLSVDEAKAARDALAKFIYEKVFEWLVDKINQSIGMGKPAGKHSSIGILDIFGFEIFQENMFEQLCINFTNEKLQQFFNQHTFKMEESVYREEEIKFDHVPYIDNQPCLDLLEAKNHGIFSLLNDELIVPKGSDTGFLEKAAQQHKATKEYGMVREKPNLFQVKHYAGDVLYESRGMLEKNRDRLNDDAYHVLATSKFAFLAALFPESAAANTGGNKMKVTLASRFCQQLNDLMNTLNATEPHYIRCIKPNTTKSAITFHGALCMQQLQYSGLFEAVKIRKSGFPFRYTHRGFVHRFFCVTKDPKIKTLPEKQACQALIDAMKVKGAVQIGKTRVLYRAFEHRQMELIRNQVVQLKILVVQSVGRGYAARKLFRRMKAIVPVLKRAMASHDIDTLNAALQQAAGVGYPMRIMREAEAMRDLFLEERRLRDVFVVLVKQDPHESYATFAKEFASADTIGYTDANVEKARTNFLQAKVIRDKVDSDGRDAMAQMLPAQLRAVWDRAQELHYTSDVVSKIDTLLFKTKEDAFVKLQLVAAVKLKDMKRVVNHELKLKSLFFEQVAPDTFKLSKVPTLLDADVWSKKKMFGNADKLRESMLVHTTTPIHHALTRLDVSHERNLAVKLFKNVMGFMGDRQYPQPLLLAQELVHAALTVPALRTELYVQVMKQLSQNSSTESSLKGWELMLVMLSFVRPSPAVENYVEAFIRKHADSPDKYLLRLHECIYADERKESPSKEEIDQVLTGSELPRRTAYTICEPTRGDPRPNAGGGAPRRSRGSIANDDVFPSPVTQPPANQPSYAMQSAFQEAC